MESQVTVVDTRPDRSKTYDPPKPILDRLLVRRLAQEEQTGFAIPEKYRQHTNRGVVVAIGDGIVLGSEWMAMRDFIGVGDIVKYGEYTSERYGPDDEELYIIRLQDVRTVERVQACDHKWCGLADPHGYNEKKLEICAICGNTREANV